MNNDTITSLLNEASDLEDRAIKLREVAKALQDLSHTAVAVKTLRKAAPTNGILLSAVPVRAAKPKKGKRKYTKKSSFWGKKK